MNPLDRPLDDTLLAEVIRQARQSTSAAINPLIHGIPKERVDVAAMCASVGLEKREDHLYGEPQEGSDPPIYVSHSEADHDVLIVRPLAWHEPDSGTAEIGMLLLEAPGLPLGGYALCRLEDRDLFLYLNHLPTQKLDNSELLAGLVSAEVSGRCCGLPSGSRVNAWFNRPQPSDFGPRIEHLLLGRETGWARASASSSEQTAWVLEGKPAIAAHYDRRLGLLSVARGLGTFLGTPRPEAANLFLRTNLKLLDGTVVALRQDEQGFFVILSRLACDDLDDVEVERAVGYLERLRQSSAPYGRSAIELLKVLEQARVIEGYNAVVEARTEPPPARLNDELHLGTQASGDSLSVRVTDLLTHAFVCGGSGSGKTIVCKNLVEEFALAGVPSIVIDLKGDLSSLACVPSGIDVDTISQYLIRLFKGTNAWRTEEIADRSRKIAGLYEALGNGDMLLDFKKRVRFRLLTPRSDAGIPLSLSPLSGLKLGSLESDGGIIGNRTLHELVEGNLRALVEHIDLSDGDTETLISVLTQLLEAAHRDQLPRDGVEGVETLVKMLFEVGKHTSKINFLDTNSAIDPRQAEKYARAMNARLGGTFRYWFDGESLSVDDLVTTRDGQVPINVINLASLTGQQDQAYAIAQINGQIIEWMRGQPGAHRPRLAYVIDEIAQDGGKGAIFPPHPHNPITKPGLTTLLKQGRAFGVSCVLATQNAKDIDYKGLGQCDTWVIGRLKTKIDIERLKTGIDAAETDTTHSFGDKIDDIVERVAGLQPGEFVIKTHSSGVIPYKQKWIRSMHERLTAEMLRNWVRLEEVEIDNAVRQAETLWSSGNTEDAIQALERVIVRETYYSKAADVKLRLCEWLYRTEEWSRVVDHGRQLRETVRSRSGYELVHYYEGMSAYELRDFHEARRALERYMSATGSGSRELVEQCRSRLQDLFVEEDDYDSFEESIHDAGQGKSGFRAFCSAMRSVLTDWPKLRGQLSGAKVIATESQGTEEIRYTDKDDRTMHRYVTEIRTRLIDLPLSAPELGEFSDEEREQLEDVRGQVAADEEIQRARESELQEYLCDATALIDEGSLSAASELISSAHKLIREGGLAAEGFERLVSLYRGTFAASRDEMRDWLLNLDPLRFELETAALFNALGFEAKTTKASGDGGVDVTALRGNRRYVIQCKRYRHPIGPGVLREFATVVRNFDADEGIFVTTSRYTDAARTEAELHDIQLVDLEGLLRLYSESGDRRGVEDSGRDCEAGILEILKRANESMAMRDVADRADWPVPECQRAMRRLIDDGVVEKTGNQRGSRYAFVRT